MMLGSDEEFMLFLEMSNSAFEVLLDSFDSVWRRTRSLKRAVDTETVFHLLE